MTDCDSTDRSEHAKEIKEAIYPRLTEEDFKVNGSLARKVAEPFLFGYKFDRNVTGCTSFVRPYFSNHPFDEFVRSDIIENHFLFSVVCLTFLRAGTKECGEDDTECISIFVAENNAFGELFVSVMLNLAAMFHNT